MVEIPASSFNESVIIHAGQTVSFYVATVEGTKLLYTRGAYDSPSTAAVNMENTDLIVYKGPAISSKFGPRTRSCSW